MRLQIGKYYSTTAKHKILIVDKLLNKSNLEYFVGYIVGKDVIVDISVDGFIIDDVYKAHDKIIKEWQEPKTGTLWINIHGINSCIPYISKKEADERRNADCIACVKVNWTEGQFDE